MVAVHQILAARRYTYTKYHTNLNKAVSCQVLRAIDSHKNYFPTSLLITKVSVAINHVKRGFSYSHFFVSWKLKLHHVCTT